MIKGNLINSEKLLNENGQRLENTSVTENVYFGVNNENISLLQKYRQYRVIQNRIYNRIKMAREWRILR